MNRFIFLLSVVFLLCTSCNKEKDPSIDDIILSPEFQMTIDGKPWKAVLYFYKTETGYPVIFGSDNAWTLHWTFEEEIKVKTYNIGELENELISSFYLYKEGKNYTLDIISGTLNIEKFDEEKNKYQIV